MPIIHLKPCIFIFLLSLMCIQLPAQTATNTTKNTIEVQVMLSDNIKDIPLPANCTITTTSDVVLKYKVVKVIHGFYLQNTILIHQHCLREAIEKNSIANHVTYIYKLKPVNPETTDKEKLTYEIVL